MQSQPDFIMVRIDTETLTITAVIDTSEAFQPFQGKDISELEIGVAKWTTTLPKLCSAEEYTDIPWCFEDYAEQDLCQTSRATQTKEVLYRYARHLATALRLGNCPKIICDREIHIDVATSHLDRGNVTSVLWESLEDPSHWPYTARPASATIICRIAPLDNQKIPRVG
jgi:hypothetical protein